MLGFGAVQRPLPIILVGGRPLPDTHLQTGAKCGTPLGTSYQIAVEPSRLLQWGDWLERFPLLCQLPVFHKGLSVGSILLKNQLQGASRKTSFNNAICNRDNDLIAAVFGVKMRRLVISVVHRNDDAQKPADFRQGFSLLLLQAAYMVGH
jgi:hypothetical protein